MVRAAQLVRASNDLPRRGDDYELCNSFSAFSAFMEQQETRIRLFKLLYFTAKSTRSFSYLRSSVFAEAEAEAAFQEQVHAVNAGIALAERLRAAHEEAIALKAKVVSVKPQKEYGFESSIDNSSKPFIPKLPTKHHALARKEPTGMVIVDEDPSNEDQQSGQSKDCDVTAVIHPYQYEIQHFTVPDTQLESSGPLPAAEMSSTPMTYVNTKEGLENLRDILNSSKEFAVDLEHHELRSYLGLTCLVQISTRTEDYIIDPFPLWNEMHILNEPFTDPKILKVFHGAEHDIEWLQRDFGIYVVNMFDTGRAMRRLEMQKFNLRYLVHHYCDVSLDKRYQLADWRVRPLDEDMIAYARSDTHYLLHCYDCLREELLEKGDKLQNLLRVVYSESALICSRVFRKPIFDKEGFRGLERRRLNNRQDAAMRVLWCWRDKVAREEDESVQCPLDFSQSDFDEESGNQMFRAKSDDATNIVERSATHTLLSVLSCATALVKLSEDDDGVRSVHDKESSPNTSAMDRVYKRLQAVGTPYESFTIATLQAQKREPAIDGDIDLRDRDETVPSFSDSQILTKKEQKRARKVARKNVDISTELPKEDEGPSYTVKRIKKDEDVDDEPNGKAEAFDYSQFDSKMFSKFPNKSVILPTYFVEKMLNAEWRLWFWMWVKKK
ncbi:3'-5' exonuclease [Ancylostoma ceylanicum]|uniref:3'-5' exonuclease n=1 Tax=Ancylostoma ceylanicum TaxID=53326 RepID=A0A0D6M4J4_9BILA|nr:3'-5' exonuclease [Ancylostoma ceylanicum]